jgi:hypothetical protein
MSRYWFRPKRYGYGATPVTWEGWALVAGFVVIVAGSRFLLLGGEMPGLTRTAIWWGIVVLAVAAMVMVSKSRTAGAWRWRWGREA